MAGYTTALAPYAPTVDPQRPPVLKPIDDPGPPVDPAAQQRLASATIAALFVRHADELRRFIVGVLRDHHAANDVLQVTFAKAIEKGHLVRNDSLKSWLFRVAFNEAMVFKRREAVAYRAHDELGRRGDKQSAAPDMNLVRWETVVGVRQAIDQLPLEQRQVVRMRIYENKKFVDIAAELQLPLGTVLTRMQLAVQKLKKALERP